MIEGSLVTLSIKNGQQNLNKKNLDIPLYIYLMTLTFKKKNNEISERILRVFSMMRR